VMIGQAVYARTGYTSILKWDSKFLACPAFVG